MKGVCNDSNDPKPKEGLAAEPSKAMETAWAETAVKMNESNRTRAAEKGEGKARGEETDGEAEDASAQKGAAKRGGGPITRLAPPQQLGIAVSFKLQAVTVDKPASHWQDDGTAEDPVNGPGGLWAYSGGGNWTPNEGRCHVAGRSRK